MRRGPATGAARLAAARTLRHAGVLAVVALAACATLRPPEPSTAASAAALGAPFDVAGRLSAHRGRDGGAASFEWQHASARDDIRLATPLGQTLAELEGDASGVRARFADGRVVEAPDFDALIERVLGAPIPVQGLAAWLRGYTHPGSPATVERDAEGRPALVRQDGWEIVYTYADDGAKRPDRLTLRYDAGEPAEVRVVIDRWH